MDRNVCAHPHNFCFLWAQPEGRQNIKSELGSQVGEYNTYGMSMRACVGNLTTLVDQDSSSANLQSQYSSGKTGCRGRRVSLSLWTSQCCNCWAPFQSTQKRRTDTQGCPLTSICITRQVCTLIPHTQHTHSHTYIPHTHIHKYALLYKINFCDN